MVFKKSSGKYAKQAEKAQQREVEEQKAKPGDKAQQRMGRER